jgi:hypothetical protein
MKSLLPFLVLLSTACATAADRPIPPAAETTKPAEMLLGGIYIPSAWMGDAADRDCDGVLKLTQDDKTTLVSSTSDRWEYRPAKGKQNWVAVGYTFPTQNFGEKPGKDLSAHPWRKLVFYIKGRDGGEKIIFKAFGGTPPDAKYKASCDEISIDTVTLTKDWAKVVIKIPANERLDNIPSILTWATNSDLNPDGCVFFIEGLRLTE